MLMLIQKIRIFYEHYSALNKQKEIKMRHVKILLCLGGFVLLALTFSGCAIFNFGGTKLVDDGPPCAELVLAENGKTDYQIVLPDKGKEEIVDNWLFAAAKLMQVAFEKNGFKIDVVQEDAKAKDKPGIYLGATGFAKENGINVEQHDDWTYYHKAVGRDLIIAGNDKKYPVNTISRARRCRSPCSARSRASATSCANTPACAFFF